jgi:outer membrane protein insertion porin family
MMIKIIYDFISVNHKNLRHRLASLRSRSGQAGLRSIRILHLSLYFFLSTNLFAQIITKIELTGNKIFSVNEYLDWLKISAGQKYFQSMEDSIRAGITLSLQENGFYHFVIEKIKIEKADSSNIILQISLNEGAQTLIRKVNINSDAKEAAQIESVLAEFQNVPLKKSILNLIVSNIIDQYENKGFPFASIKIESIEFGKDEGNENHFANLFLTINPRQRSVIDKIEISGNTKTKDNVIIRSSQIRISEEYSQTKVDAIPEKLNRLRFFEPVELPLFYFNSKNEGVLKISIKEKETNYFDGIAGYVPALNDKESGYLTGFVNVNLRNLFGSGRAASFRWQQENRFSQELELRYLEPWFFDLPFNIEAGLFQRKQDSTYIQRKFELQIEFIATHEISASVLINSQSTIPTERNFKTLTVYNSSSFTSGVNLRIDTRDDFYSPTSGLYFNNSYKYSAKKINGPMEYITFNMNTNISQQRLEFDFSIYKQFFGGQVSAFGIHGRELRGDEVEISDLYFLGGTNSLRGYQEKQFQGNRLLWTNLEYRFLLSRRSYAFLFFDTGYFLRNEDKQRNIAENSSFKIGYGFGLNIETVLGVLGVSFALAKGDSFGDGKIHFGIVNEF